MTDNRSGDCFIRLIHLQCARMVPSVKILVNEPCQLEVNPPWKFQPVHIYFLS